MVVARAGGGKTSLLLDICQERPLQKCVILTYNRSLADECNVRIQNEGITNAECSTIHSMFGRCTGNVCQTDIGLLWTGDVSRFDANVVLIDEAQDLRPSFVSAINLMIPHNAQLIVVGDPKQTLYSYIHGDAATAKYLINAPDHFGGRGGWCMHTLTGSYRLNKSVAAFASAVWGCRIDSLSSRPDCRVKYVLANPWTYTVRSMVRHTINKYGPENVLIMHRTVGGVGNPLRRMINSMLGSFQFHIMDHSRGFTVGPVPKKAVRVWTYCASKGVECEAAIVFGIDRQSFTNDIGVAVSRCREQLIVVHDDRSVVDERLRGLPVEWLKLQRDGTFENNEDVKFGNVNTAEYTKEQHSVFDRISIAPVLLNAMMQDCPLSTHQVNNGIQIGCLSPNGDDVSCLYTRALKYSIEMKYTQRCADSNVVQLQGSGHFDSAKQLHEWASLLGLQYTDSCTDFPISFSRVRYLSKSGALNFKRNDSTVYIASDSVHHLLNAYKCFEASRSGTDAVRMANEFLALDSYRDKVVRGYDWVEAVHLYSAMHLIEKQYDIKKGEFNKSVSYRTLHGKIFWVSDDTCVDVTLVPDVTQDQQLNLMLLTAMQSAIVQSRFVGHLYHVRLGVVYTCVLEPVRAERFLDTYIEHLVEPRDPRS